MKEKLYKCILTETQIELIIQSVDFRIREIKYYLEADVKRKSTVLLNKIIKLEKLRSKMEVIKSGISQEKTTYF